MEVTETDNVGWKVVKWMKNFFSSSIRNRPSNCNCPPNYSLNWL